MGRPILLAAWLLINSFAELPAASPIQRFSAWNPDRKGNPEKIVEGL